MPRGGYRYGSGRKPAGAKRYKFEYLDEWAQGCFKRLQSKWGVGDWRVISRALEIADAHQKLDDPAETLGSDRARDARPHSGAQALRRYQLMAGADQKTMASLCGVKATTYGRYLWKAATIPDLLLKRARFVARETCYGKDPDVDCYGTAIPAPTSGVRQTLNTGRTMEIELEPWEECLERIRGYVEARGPRPVVEIEPAAPAAIGAEDFIRQQEERVAAASAGASKPEGDDDEQT